MAVITNAGRVAIAEAVKALPVHLAWGTGKALWHTTQSQSYTFSNNKIQLTTDEGMVNVNNESVTGQGTTYNDGADYLFSNSGEINRMITGRIPNDATVTVNYSIIPPSDPTLITKTALAAEVGRIRADQVDYCASDSAGTIVTPSGNFTVSSSPTSNLYMKFTFDFNDNASSTIKEIGIFVGTVLQSGLSPSIKNFTGGQITNRGKLLALECPDAAIVRSTATRESFTFVVSF